MKAIAVVDKNWGIGKEGGLLFCIIHFSLFTIYHSFNRIFVMKNE